MHLCYFKKISHDSSDRKFIQENFRNQPCTMTSFLKITWAVLIFSWICVFQPASSQTLSPSTSTSTEEVEETPSDSDSSCNASFHQDRRLDSPADRIRRAAPLKQGVVVCITSKDSSVNLGNSKDSKGHAHKHKDEDYDDDDNSEEAEEGKQHVPSEPDDEESDSDETVEESDDVNHNHKDIVSTGSGHHSQPSAKPPRGRGKKKGKENFRLILEEQFSYRNWSSEWVHAKNPDNSTTTSKVFNKFSRVYARKSNHSRLNYGIITHNKGGEFYLIATTFPPFSTKNESLVMQFSVQFQSNPHCQLVFLRLFDCQFSTDEFGMRTPYVMQVGPYVCGTSRTSRVSAEFQEPGKTTIKPVHRNVEPVNNTSVNTYALALEPDGTYHIIVNTVAVQNGSLKDEFQQAYKGYTGICGAGLVVWHSVLDKYFKGQMIIDDILVVNDMDYATKRRSQILNLYSE